MLAWSKWKPFPDPHEGQLLTAPFGPGVYELRHAQTRKLILVGIGGNCAYRMSSLLPKPFGAAGRRNSDKRKYVFRNLPNMEYRCLACQSRCDAKTIEDKMLTENDYHFLT